MFELEESFSKQALCSTLRRSFQDDVAQHQPQPNSTTKKEHKI
jgi:hypothetical protein